MVLIKGLGFALVIPAKEIMYIPTSKDVQFKTKGWIETFGARSAKMGGAQLSNVFKYQLNSLMAYGTFVSLALIISWASAAWYVGKKNRDLIESDEIIQ
jgi:AAA family ATP:ADP antiporter